MELEIAQLRGALTGCRSSNTGDIFSGKGSWETSYRS